jgi:ankyrin repeat protein
MHGPGRKNYDEVSSSALVSAILCENLGDVVGLICEGADVDFANERGMTPLLYAACCGNHNIVKAILEAGAETGAVDADMGWNALFFAIDEPNNEQIVELLLEHGCNPDARDKEGCTLLSWASYDGSTNYVQILLDAGADVNAKDTRGFTSLMAACANNHYRTASLLLENMADPNIGGYGMTALMVAAEVGSKKIVQLLLQNGADIELKNCDGDDAIKIAEDEGKWDVMVMLRKAKKYG